MLRIGEFARLANVSVKLVRHYDEIGLLPAHVVDRHTGYRYYSVTQLARLNQLLIYRSLGFSLKEMRRLVLDNAQPDQLREMLTHRRDSLRAKIDAECARLDEIETRIAQIGRHEWREPFEVTIRSVEAGVAVSLRRTCASYDEVSELLQFLRAKLPSRAAVVGQGAIWHKCQSNSDQIDCEALVFLDPARSPHPVGLNVVKVAPCTVASVVCDDTAENSRLAYRAAIHRAGRLGYGIAGPMRERYSDHAESAIEAQFPLSLSVRSRPA